MEKLIVRSDQSRVFIVVMNLGICGQVVFVVLISSFDIISNGVFLHTFLYADEALLIVSVRVI